MKQIRALRANGITMLVSSVITAVCVGVCWKHFPIAVQAIYIVRRSNGRTEHLVEKTGKGE